MMSFYRNIDRAIYVGVTEKNYALCALHIILYILK